MPIASVKNNVQYGGNLINQKYAPLENIQLGNPRATYDAIFQARSIALTQLDVFPKLLNFYFTPPAVVNVNQPPMVVISSNRAEWLATLFQNATATGQRAGGFTDAHTFDNGPTPWFSPLRSGNRQVYIVVHHTEYDYYETKIGAVPNVKVVGYKYTAGHDFDIVGFGASRFAALELVQLLQYHKAWTVDDNVVNINGFSNDTTQVEGQMTNAIWAIGFAAATKNLTEGDLYAKATFQAKAYNFANDAPGLLQQVVLWNVDLLSANRFNMSPLFFTSNEDTSFSNFLQVTNRTEKIVTELAIIKLEPKNDTGNYAGNSNFSKRRGRLLSIFANLEEVLSISPISGGGDQPLWAFINDVVLPNSTEPRQDARIALSRAVEQILALAVQQLGQPNFVFSPYQFPNNIAPRSQQQAPATL